MAEHCYFGKAYRPLYSDDRLNGPEIRVLLSVLALGNKNGECEASTEAVMADANIRRSTAYAAIKRVIEYGLLTHENGIYKVSDSIIKKSRNLDNQPAKKSRDLDNGVQNPRQKVQNPRHLVQNSRQSVYPIEEEVKKNKKNPVDFDIFYSNYPKKRKRPDALKAYQSAENLPDVQFLNEVVNAWKMTDEWTKDSGKFIPYPATWLRAQGWLDDLPNAKESDEDRYLRMWKEA